MRSSGKPDRMLFASFLALIIAGFLIFISASLGLLARNGADFSSVAFKQAFIGLFLGSIALWLFYKKISLDFWKKHALAIMLFSLGLTLLVFVPHIGFAHGGAKRWLSFGPLSFQPSEFLKLGLVCCYAAWLAHIKDKVRTFKFGFLPLFVLIAVSGVLMMLQPDTGTFLVMFAALVGMHIAAGGRWRDIASLFVICTLGILALFYVRPYIKERMLTFLDPGRDPLGAGYQIQQSQIAIGSGKVFGRGFGQSIQKFNILPEPIGDSIFAVASEEFGFVGSTLLILLFVFFALRGFKMASRVIEPFPRLFATGIVILILAQSFVNIGSMLGVLPLTGIPLIFVSQGGTALLIALSEMGVLLQISKKAKA